jgi:hypothetical protein
VTNLETDSRGVVRFYNKRGTAEQWIKEGKQAVKMTRLSCHRFRSNEVRLWLSLIAYNLGNQWRRLVVDQLAAAVSEDGWPIDQARSLLLAAPGREPPDSATVRQYAGADSWAAPSGEIAEAVRNREIDPALPGTEKCLRHRLHRAANSGSGKSI